MGHCIFFYFGVELNIVSKNRPSFCVTTESWDWVEEFRSNFARDLSNYVLTNYVAFQKYEGNGNNVLAIFFLLRKLRNYHDLTL